MAETDDLISDAGKRMDKSVDHARNEFNTVRTGRASARSSTASPSTTTGRRRR